MGKAEPMENLHQLLCTFKCRMVIINECHCIKVLSIETSSFLNVETEPRMKWCGNGETEPMKNLHLGNVISASAIIKKSKNGCHFINTVYKYCMHHTKNFQITDPPKLSVNRNRISMSAIMKKSKNGCHLVNYIHPTKKSNY